MPKVALVVLAHNGWATTNKFLSLLYQNTSQDAFRLFFVDNGSSDGTPDLLDQFAKDASNMTILKSTSNTGVIGGRNIGFDWFAGKIAVPPDDCDYLSFLDNDQFVHPGWLDHHLAVLNRGYDLISVEAWQMNRSFVPVQKNTRLNEHFNYVGCGGMLMRRAVSEEVGTFDERFNPSYFEDPDYCMRAKKAGFKIGWNFKARLTHLPHQTLGKATDKQQRFIRSLQRFREKWKGEMMPHMKQVKLPEFDE